MDILVIKEALYIYVEDILGAQYYKINMNI